MNEKGVEFSRIDTGIGKQEKGQHVAYPDRQQQQEYHWMNNIESMATRKLSLIIDKRNKLMTVYHPIF